MTAMAAAFVKAGFSQAETVPAQLKRMMREAISAGGGKADPSRDHFIVALSKANDPALLWELFASVRMAVIGNLFTETLIQMRAEGALKDAASSATHAAAGAKPREPQGHGATSPAAAPPQRPSRLRYESTEKVARLSILRTFKINGQPLADVTGAEAREWLKKHQRDGRFVALVTYQVPDEIKVGAIVPEEEADRMFKLASDAGNG